MNRQITQLFVLVLLLFGLLVAFTSRWTVFEAEDLRDNTANRRPLLEEQRIPRGAILARDGTPLAQSKRIGRGAARRYERFYPQGSLFAHAVGYSYIDRGQAGLEKSRNDELVGRESEFESIIDELAGGRVQGDDLRTTLDPAAQRVALQALGGRAGSIVAMEPSTGRIRVMASTPDYDPNSVKDRFAELNRDRGRAIFNRATQARYPPGSTFKVVTAAAALDSGRFEPDSIIDGKSPKEIGGVPLANFGDQSYGPITLTQALTNSVNTVWGEVGEKLTSQTIFEYMEKFGFGDEPKIDYPSGQLLPSGVFKNSTSTRILEGDDPIDVGRVSIGQERLQVTPLQMATVAATVANGGVRMEPRLVEQVVSRDGRVRERVRPKKAERVIDEEAAQQLGLMMSKVVEEGSGTAAALQGIPVAGKTGTAEVDGGASNQAWFIGFAPVRGPKMAIAVTVERTQGQGGTVAAPLAKRVLQELVRRG